jgi:hypothetical protein
MTKMRMEHVEHFLLLLGARRVVKHPERGWIQCSCPLAIATHKHGTDSSPSFGVKVPEDDDKAPYFHCYACGASGPLSRLLFDVEMIFNTPYKEATEYLSRFRIFNERKETVVTARRRVKVYDKFANWNESRAMLRNPIVPDSVLQQYPLLSEKSALNAHYYVLFWLTHDRRISLPAITKFQLRLYEDTLLDRYGVIFPVLSRDGKFVYDLWVRLIDEKRFFRLTADMARCPVDYRAPNLWFGNHVYTTERPLVLVEGALDALRLYSLGVENVMASMGMPSREQISSVYAPIIYLGYDNDGEGGAGANMTKKLVRELPVPAISVLDWSTIGLKDAGELTSEAQLRMVFDSRVRILKSPRTNLIRTVDDPIQ